MSEGESSVTPLGLDRVASDCIANGKRLKDDAELLLEYGRAPTALAIAVLAQEEFAKAFLLTLAHRKVIPWTREFQKALQNHECKHLAGVMMEWLGPPLDEALIRSKAGREGKVIEFLPVDVAVAVNILRYEKFELFRKGYGFKDPEDSGFSRKVSKGLIDRIKQKSLYAGIGVDEKGAVSFLPIKNVSIEMAQEHLDRASQYCKFASDAASDTVLSFMEYRLFCQILEAVFEGGGSGTNG